jgi:uroporphyrinogen decarboxylase
MAEMTSRERVLTAIAHQEPDRVPTAIWGGPYGMVDEIYFALLKRFELGEPVPQFRTGHTVTYLDDRVLDRLGTDTRYVWPGLMPSSPQQETGDPDVFLDGFGQPWRRALPYYYPTAGILAEGGIDDIDRVVPWPDTADPKWTAGMRERALKLRETTDCFLVARQPTSHGPFQLACDLRSTDRFLMDMALDPDFVGALLERVSGTLEGFVRGVVEAVGDLVDMVELPGDDYASNVSTILSPAMFRQYFKPILARLVAIARNHRADLKVMFHSDGMIEPLLGDLIEIGVDVMHPIEPVEAMDLGQVKRDYGDKLAFLGGIDISHAMPGSQADVIAEVRRRIGQLGPGGGYILAPSNHIQADVPPENVVTLFRAAHEFGVYPLGD